MPPSNPPSGPSALCSHGTSGLVEVAFHCPRNRNSVIGMKRLSLYSKFISICLLPVLHTLHFPAEILPAFLIYASELLLQQLSYFFSLLSLYGLASHCIP